MIAEHDRAVLTADLHEHALQAGDVGTVVHVYGDGGAYEIEFFRADGHTLDVVTVEADQVRGVSHLDMLHVRRLSAPTG